jgi:hypothetical protein
MVSTRELDGRMNDGIQVRARSEEPSEDPRKTPTDLLVRLGVASIAVRRVSAR